MLQFWQPLITFIIMILINFIYPLINGTSVGNMPNNEKLGVAPANYAFSIWGIIYIGLILLIMFKSNWTKNSLNYFAMSCIFNSLWIIVWTTMPRKKTNVYFGNIMLPLLVISLFLFWNENLTSKIKKTHSNNIILQNIIALYLSWCIGASLINTGISLKSFVGDNIINVFIISCLCIFHISWQLYGTLFAGNTSFIKDSLMVPVAGLWTSIAIFNNGRTPDLGLISTIVTSISLCINLVNLYK